ncbi:hypothetical protein QO005_003549 [Rhizobium paknamense]|uniref:Integrase n=1 Tax=Rhizobium paknamense TaxID=1206817 RepID=A0ABU0IG27_9HYPH|nr:hypothetical protein [Rhizobium paknamense]
MHRKSPGRELTPESWTSNLGGFFRFYRQRVTMQVPPAAR